MNDTSNVRESHKHSDKTRSSRRAQDKEMSPLLLQILKQQREFKDKLNDKFYFVPLKIANTMREFNKIREVVHGFNKVNVAAEEQLTWGDNGKYNRVESVNSLKSWLLTEAAVKLKIDPSYYDDFLVVNDGGDLVTFDDEYKGGYHSSAFWIPDRKYSCEPSQRWSHTCMKETDPRRQYVDPKTGKVWSTSCIETRKRKVSGSVSPASG